MRIRAIRKRDGREVPYDRSKIASAVARAEAAAGDPRAGFAAEVTTLVEMLLKRRYAEAGDATPGIEEIQDLVERALVEMGAAPVAKAYILYREKRTQARAALVMREEGAARARPGSEAHRSDGEGRSAARALRVEAKDGAPAWSKGRIVAALMSEADLPRASAEAVAARVETRVFASGLRSITPALVRELVDNELVDLGFENALRRHRPIGIPRHDLRALLLDVNSGRPPGGSVESAIAGEILARYAAEDLLPASVADLVRAGEIDFEDLGRPHLPLSLSVACESLRSGIWADGKPGAEAAGALLPEIGGLAAQVSSSVAIEGLEPFLYALDRSSAAALRGWLAGVGGIARASGREIELVLSAQRARTLEALLGALASLEREHAPDALPRLVIEAGSLESLSGSAGVDADHLLRRGLLVPCWSADAERYAGPALARRTGERGAIACCAALVLDLPRLARRAGAWREDRLFEGAAARIEIGIQGLLALGDFQREARDPEAPRARAAFALAPAGIAEALSILGDGELREEQAGRLLAFLVEAAERIGRAHGIVLRVSPCFSGRAAERFARIDALEFRVRQPWLFAEAAGSRPGAGRPYSAAFENVSEAVLCALIGSLPTGSLRPSTVLAALAAARPEVRDLPGLSAARRLERLRGRVRGSARALYALPSPFHFEADEARDASAELFAASADSCVLPTDLFGLPVSTVPGLRSDS